MKKSTSVRPGAVRYPSAKQFSRSMEETGRAAGLSEEMLSRSVNDAFSGGEKKKSEIIQMGMIGSRMIILDEIDSGLDIDALKEAMETNLSEKRLIYGGSTISQQTVKNVFLNPSRNPLRKWHELLLTIGMERNLSKKRILEHYLNVAEFGRGIYGVDAAARHYWNVPASKLTSRQAIELAATLPSPVRNNPKTRTSSFNNRVNKIRRYF